MNNVKIENVKYIKTGGSGDLFLADDGEYRAMGEDMSNYFSYLVDVVNVNTRVYTSTAGAMKVDWGDGEVSSATGGHYYANTGSYTVKIFASNVKNCITIKGADLTKVLALPNGLENMDSAFIGQTKLTECCDLPNTVQSCRSTFSSCISLMAMASFDGLGDVDCTRMYEKCTSLVDCEPINDSITICDYMFIDCTSLVIPPALGEGVKNCSYMFNRCSSLIHTPVFTENIEDVSYMFYRCENLVKVYPMKGLSKATNGEGMFGACYSLTTVLSLPNGLTNGRYMFAECSSLTTVSNLPNGLIDGVSMFNNCGRLTTVSNLPDGLTNGGGMFRYCTSLTTIPSLPNGLTNGEDMFYSCSSLTTVSNLPNSLINGASMFIGCGLTEVPNLPSTIENYSYMFYVNKITSIPDDIMSFINANPDLGGKEKSCFGNNPITYPQPYSVLKDSSQNPSYRWFSL